MSLPVHSQGLEERILRSTSPSLLSATVGQRLLTRLDDGSGCTSPEKVVALWTEEGIHNSRDILQTLEFSLEERLCLAELTLALDNELLVSGNGIHQAALVSYKNEIHYLQVLADQACQERDKAKADLDQADRRNLQLVREVDDHHATMESLNESKIKGLEQEFRDKLTALRSESEYESEVLLDRVEKERERLREELELLRAQELNLQEDICTAAVENRRLEEEVGSLKEKLAEAEGTISKLQKDLDHLLQEKYGGLDGNGSGQLNQEEHFTEVFKEYEKQCRELQDRNDELCSELELLKTQGSGRRARQSMNNLSAQDWSDRRTLTTESDSDDPEMKKGTSPRVRKKLQVTDKNGLGSLEGVAPPVSIETELAMEQMKERYEREIQDLKIQLETKVNFYERSMELMRQNMEVERKDISQSFKLEISELEELKARAEARSEKMHHAIEKLEAELRGKSTRSAWSPEQERRIQREQAELEQNYAREISNIVLRLTSEKDQLEAELKLKMDQEVLLVRERAEMQILHMKAEHDRANHSLLNQLQLQHKHLQEQSELHRRELRAWESRAQELEQKARRKHLLSTERWSEDQAKICGRVAQERKKIDEEHQEELKKLGEHICFLEAQVELASRAEEELVSLQKQLEEKLEEMCVQLEDNTASMKAQDALLQRLNSELHAKERAIEMRHEKEQKLALKLSQLEQKLKVEREDKQELLKQKELLQKEMSRSISDLKETEQKLLHKMSQLTSELENQRSKSEPSQKEIHVVQGRSHHDLPEEPGRDLQEKSMRDGDLTSKEVASVEDLGGLVFEALQKQIEELSEKHRQMLQVQQNLQGSLDLEQEEVKVLRAQLTAEQEDKRLLEEESSRYQLLANQLSSQIIEMEVESKEETEKLVLVLQTKDERILNLSHQLEAKAEEMDLLWAEVQCKMNQFQEVTQLCSQVQLLTNQLKDKEGELRTLKEESHQLQQSLKDSQVELQCLEQVFKSEKSQMKAQLLEMEGLVLTLESQMDPTNASRFVVLQPVNDQNQTTNHCIPPIAVPPAHLDDVTSENSALKDRLAVLQKDVQALEEELCSKRKKLEEMEREHTKNRADEEKLRKEARNQESLKNHFFHLELSISPQNSRSREEVLELSTRNLQLSSENARLSSRLCADQESVQTLTDRVARVIQERDDAAGACRELQDSLTQQEKRSLELQEHWQTKKLLLERELHTAQQTLQRLTALESALTSQSLKNQALEEEQERLLKDLADKQQKLKSLQESLHSSEAQVEKLHSQMQSMWQEKEAHIQEAAEHLKRLQESQEKVRELEDSISQLRRENASLDQRHTLQEQKALCALQIECKSLQEQNQELLNKVSQLQSQELELQKMTHECLTLRNQLTELESAKQEAAGQALRAGGTISMLQAQHARELQELKDMLACGGQERVAHLQTQLSEMQRRMLEIQDLQRSQAKQASVQMSLQQEQYEKLMVSMQERMDEVEAKLKTSRAMLQEKVSQLKEQLGKNAKCDVLLKDLYVENSQLMKALQVTEQRQKSAEKKSFILEEKVVALNRLLRKIAPASLTA
ncbi:hypothetical protein DNTS_025367 [Danionella cerebrum]|uniref:Ninein-like protein n=1 Tax=Danionella cerebrum TaxID=2873325 RepID=A0A553Q2V5_9TELE|nr:hypothetical protein DNTS_025367 [Danionella translucida]